MLSKLSSLWRQKGWSLVASGHTPLAVTLGSQPALPAPSQQASSAAGPAPSRLLPARLDTAWHGTAVTHSGTASCLSCRYPLFTGILTLPHRKPSLALPRPPHLPPTPAPGSLEGKFQISSPKYLGQASDMAFLSLRVPGDPLSLKGQDGL